MTDAEAVRRVALALPRAYEVRVGGLWKLRVGQLVFVAFDEEERAMGLGFPREERDALVASAPEKFFLPPARDLRYRWVCARLGALDEQEMRELVTDAWRMCVPKMLHDLPDLPEPTATVWDLLDQGDLGDLSKARLLLHPYLHWQDGRVQLHGRENVLAHLAARPRPRPPVDVEIRDGQVYRWTR